MTRTRTWIVAALCVLLSGLVVAQAPKTAPAQHFVWPGETEALPAAAAAAVDAIRTPALAAHIAFLASPSLEGRGLGGRGLEASAEYVAAALAVAGVQPLAASGGSNPAAAYFQPVSMREVRGMRGVVSITARGTGARPVERGRFVSAVDALFPELPPAVLTGGLVFAGYGIRESSPARDDYQGLDVRGKVVVVLAGLPAGDEWRTPELVARYAAEAVRPRFGAKSALAASLGAKALLAIEGPGFTRILAAALAAARASAKAPFFVLAEGAQQPPVIPVIRLSARAGGTILGPSAAGAPRAKPRELPGVAATIRISGLERPLTARNVIAAIPGSDPKLKEEALVIGAHLDHLGQSGGRYYPGADDNASGVASLLEIARAFAASPQKPKRTVVFAFWTGEEEGHLGSEHYVRHPLWPLERTAVYLNLDMIGHPWTKAEIEKLVSETKLPRGEEFLSRVKPEDFVELGVAEWAPDVAEVLARAARGTNLALRLDRTDGKSGGSDYREFARRELPWVRFFGNYFNGYHEPTDTVETLDVGQVRKMARLALASAWMLADR